MKRSILSLIVTIAVIFISACGSYMAETAEPAVLPEATTLPVVPIEIEVESMDAMIYTTQNNLQGNHLVEGSTYLQKASILDIPLNGTPVWLVGAPFKGGAIFVTALEDGSVQAFEIHGQTYEPMDTLPEKIPAGMPPTLLISKDEAQVIPLPQDTSATSSPILVGDKLLYIASNGDLVMNDNDASMRLPIDALPDTRILVDENERVLVLAQPTTRYDHGVLGDALEASAIILIETKPEFRVVQTIPINPPDVIEGISPIWVDMNGDGQRDIVVTLSNDRDGARIVAFNEDGSLLAESNPIGTGYRWRHQIAVALLGIDDKIRLVSVRTPHIGGIIEIFELKNGKLEIVNEISGYSSHGIGSRNLDSALTGDFNDDGQIELLVPNQERTSLGIISMDGVIAMLPLDGQLSSNLSAVTVNDRLYIGAGTVNRLRLWLP